MSAGRSGLGVALLLTLAAGVGWGLVTLHGVFTDERVEAAAAVDGRRRVLDRYASAAFERALAERLRRARPTIEVALTDPLASIAGLYCRVARICV